MTTSRAFVRKFLVMFVSSVVGVGVTFAADHRDSPSLLQLLPKTSNPEVRSLDINDMYLFRSPTNPNNTVMMMTVNPLLDPGEVVFFSSLGSYEFKISNGAGTDVNPEITFSCKFTAPRAGRQEIRVTRINHLTNRSELIARGQTGSNIAIRGGGQVQANVFDDPFFFDFNAFRAFDADGAGPGLPREFNDAGTYDFFGDANGISGAGSAGFNTGIIVIELPSASLTGGGTSSITLWGRTLTASGVQADRMAIPTINTVVIRGNRFIGPFPGTPNPLAPAAANFKDQFNLTLPINDRAVWGNEVRMALTALGAENPAGLADALLPDVLTLNVNSSAGFVGSLNGRQLADDVIDFELGLVTDGALTTDGVPANNKAFRNRFPYAATSN